MRNTLLTVSIVATFFTVASAQPNSIDELTLNQYLESPRAITTAVPIMGVSPDARAGGMGDVGVASDPDVNSVYWNPAKLAFLPEGTSSLAVSYTPWLNQLVGDINLAYLAGAFKLDENQAMGVSLRYFSLGEIVFKDNNNQDLGTYQPYEFALTGSYALKLSPRMSLAVGLRYFFSDLTQGQQVGGASTKPGQTVASDIGYYYKSREYNMEGGKKQSFSVGLNVSNIGGKISYSDEAESDFIPTNLRLGGAYNMKFDKYNRFVIMADINKLLVPTPPLREGVNIDLDGDGITNEIVAGKDDDVNGFQGIFQSFNDAPNGTSEEFEELIYNIGAEFWYDDRFAFRGGYQYEDEQKGGRQYFTIGLGLRYNVFGLDMSYLIPASATVRSPLENTLRFTLIFNFNNSEG
jgi:hypothetical protein